ncbi:fimbrial protein [Pseudomonas sp. P9_35]|uniref:fimbrial protein n=1 Tax=unclassified Pseudomonas TaxID=196821 RepID=UPI002A36FFFD|nr:MULTISPECIES: fimbrial protein [unclassified Pseudomonas]WPN65641.1 fimbrial protein [Pseudomonas sp. P9_32]WPN71392.1 fimbrial protein [Pseudomonas sp. P9_35]
MFRSARYVPLSSLVLFFIGAEALAQDVGRVDMRGSIVETACAIDISSRDQAIDMATIPLSQIIRDGSGVDQPFSVRLVSCVLPRLGSGLAAWRQFQVTFDGRADSGFFGVDGNARGVALMIADSHGSIAVPGAPLPLADLVPGDKVLNYSMRLVGNNQALRSGNYYSTIRFKIDYY